MIHHIVSYHCAPITRSRLPKFTPAYCLALTVFCLSIVSWPHVYAQSQFSVGQRLNAAQIQSLGTLRAVKIGSNTYQILQSAQSASGHAYTLVLDARGRVGQTQHELQVVEQPTAQVKQQLAAITSQAQEVTYYDNADTTLLRFATLEQAAQALADARAAMPKAEMGIPIVFSGPKLH